jgi:hypothetical protein
MGLQPAVSMSDFRFQGKQPGQGILFGVSPDPLPDLPGLNGGKLFHRMTSVDFEKIPLSPYVLRQENIPGKNPDFSRK